MGRKRILLEHRAHGTRATYCAGCKCEGCNTANNTYQRDRYTLRQMVARRVVRTGPGGWLRP